MRCKSVVWQNEPNSDRHAVGIKAATQEKGTADCRLTLRSRNRTIQCPFKRHFETRHILIELTISPKWFWRMSIRARQLHFHLLLAVAGGLTCAAAIAIGLTILWLRSDAIANASRDSDNLATVLAHQLENSVESIDLVLTEIRDTEEQRGRRGLSDLDQEFREDTYRFL